MKKSLIILAAALSVAACKTSGSKVVSSPSAQDFAPYIKAYTGGIIDEGAVIRIDLQEDASQMPEDGLFSLSPRTEGTVKWNGPGSVSFIPEKLEAGKNYNVRFALGKVLSDAKAPEYFNFAISVKGTPEPEAEVQEEEPATGEPFRVRKAALQEDRIEVVLSAAPVNAKVKGLVELGGVARSYLQVQDTLLTVHFEGAGQKLELVIDQALRDGDGNTLGESFRKTFTVGEEKPAVEIPLKGNILPGKESLLLPFRAVNLGAVEVRVVKIYEKNVLMFLQDNELGEEEYLRRSGRLVYKGDIPLDASKDLHKWNTHAIDLSGLFKQEPGAIYRIRISFRMDQSLWGGKEYLHTFSSGVPSPEDEANWDIPSPYYWDNDYDWSEYNWKESKDPSKPSYYMDSDRFPSIQLISSDLGLMAEYAGSGTIWIAVTDLITAGPVSGASVEVFDYQLQSLAKGSTDSQGFAKFETEHKPFAIVAKAGGSTAYLKMSGANERQLSRFDVSGEKLSNGLKAFIYGERGVWRPGDTLHVNAIVADKGRSLPEGHPATLEIYTPAGQFYSKLVRKPIGSFYSFDIPTKADDPTGYWNAYLKVGGSSFHKTLHVETVKPNRLKINASYGDILRSGETISVKIQASWLSGSPASGNKARAQLKLAPGSASPFPGFEQYVFKDPSSNFTKAEYELFDTRLDANGNASVKVELPRADGTGGLLQASITTSVQEDGGDESFTVATMPYSPFDAYVGIKVPEGEYLETDTDQKVSLVSVNESGKRLGGRNLEYAVYKLQWNWWWDNPGSGELDSYLSGSSARKIAGGTVVSSASGDASFTIRENYPNWGRYLILAKDIESGHVSGRTVTIDWPEYRGRASRQDPESLTMISFSTDKPSYQTGEKATVFIPAAPGGRALVSLENSARVLRREWVKTGDKDTPYSFEVTADMAPNFYIHITLLQPYGASANDLPIRLYGVQRVNVENPGSHLEPVINAPAVLHPEETFTIKVSEASGKPMTYTLAIVDEGLLDLTAFKTPDPWSRMYRNEALGVGTWDMYDSVIGAFGGKLTPVASIGGDEEALLNARKDNRFNPVVLCLPPRTLEKGTDVLRLKLPMYVGSVRIMVVAARDGAFGNAEKTVPVQNPLMVVTTLPRILGSGEEVSVPVNVFAMEDGVKEATVSIKADGPVKLVGPTSQTVSFEGKGDKLVRFALKATGEGVSHITVNASGASHKASETIALTVKNPYPEVTSVVNFTLEKGASRKIESGSNLQIAGFPVLNAGKLFADMKQYPYNCGEQLSARGITVLSLIPLLGTADAADAKALAADFVSKLYSRQNTDGGFAYWPGGKSSSWVSSMAGHFLTLCSEEGISVNAGVLKAWKGYQNRMCQIYRLSSEEQFSQLDQAYRLYTLALAGDPSLSSMNRMKESGKLGQKARWMLASAYAICGKKAVCDALLEGIGKDFPDYEPYNITYGSSHRDRMIALEALVRDEQYSEAVAFAGESLPSRTLSTQESAFTAVAYRALYDKVQGSGINVSIGPREIVSAKSSVSTEVTEESLITNNSDGTLFCTVLSTSREARSKASSNGLKLEVSLVDENGRSVNPASLPQGTRFKAVIKVSNTSNVRELGALALSYAIPSGWEIQNDRLSGVSGEEYDHMDIRDDRADWFFALPAGRYKTFTLGLRAAYEGSFVLPATVCTDMYRPEVNASTADGTCAVTAAR